MKKAAALIIDFANSRVIAEFHEGDGCHIEAQKTIDATLDDFPGSFKLVVPNDEALPDVVRARMDLLNA